MAASGRTVQRQSVPRTARRYRMLRAAGLVFTLIGLSSLAVRAGQAGPIATPTPASPPLANLNQMMRAILFPNANVIFNVQLEDPDEKPAPAPAQKDTAGFSITSWGDRLYPRWDVVSYSALALEESAVLLNRTERLCQNGRPVPVTLADWTRFTKELADTAKAVYTASQAKNRDVVIELTGRLNDSCQSCHAVYRRGVGVDRCVPRP